MSEAGRIGKEKKRIKTGTVRPSEGLSSITSIGQLCTRTLKKRSGRKKLERKSRWRRKGEKTMRRNPRKGKESRGCYVIFFLFYIIKWLRTYEMQKGRKI